MLWINVLLQSLTEEVWKGFEETLTPYVENDHEVIGVVPTKIRPFYIARHVVAVMHDEALAEKKRGGTSVDPAVWMRRFEALDALIRSFLDDARIPGDLKNTVLGVDWQFFRVKERVILLPSREVVEKIERGSSAYAEHLVTRRVTSRRPSTVRVGV